VKTPKQPYSMFLATTYSPRPAPTGATPQASPDRVVTLLTDDERMSSPTHRRRDYPRFTEAPISPPGSCPTPMTLRAPPPELGVTTAVREGPSNSPGRADVPIPSSAAAPPQIPTVRIRAYMHLAVRRVGKSFFSTVTIGFFPSPFRR